MLWGWCQRCFKVPQLGKSCATTGGRSRDFNLTKETETISASKLTDTIKSEIGRHHGLTEFVELKGTHFTLH
jgi:hypothetical protein